MTGQYLSENIEKLGSVFLNIKYMKSEDRIIAPNMKILDDLKDALNKIFDENLCLDVLYTLNTDKPFFGIRVSPYMGGNDCAIILTTDSNIRLEKYSIEFDSKLFDIGLSESELVAYTVHEISAMMDNTEIFFNLRALIDAKLVSQDDIISIRDSVRHSQLIKFAIKNTLFKLSSMLFKEAEDIAANAAIQAADLVDDVLAAKAKISATTDGESIVKDSTPSILNWAFIMYRNIKTNSRIMLETLRDSICFTASKLEIKDIQNTIDSITNITNELMLKESTVDERGKFIDLNRFFEECNMSSLNELSLFKSLKKNGLRGIENDLYEYSMRVKNCTTSDDAYMILRGINSRLGILEDYLSSEYNLSDSERKHWEQVAQDYRELRIALSKKKFKEKQWGLFYRYDLLDDEDTGTQTKNSTNEGVEPEEEEAPEVDVTNDEEGLDEGFLFGKKDKKKDKSAKPNEDHKANMKYLNDKYQKKIAEIIEGEYENNKAKWDKIALEASKKAKEMKYSEDDYAEFSIDVGTVDYVKGNEYYLSGEFFDADQMLGFEVEHELESKFFAAVTPKLKQLCGNEFVRMEGDPDDAPGVFSVVLKVVK